MGERLASARFPFPPVLSFRVSNGLPLQIGDCIGTAAGEGRDVIFPITGTSTARPVGRGAWMLALELARDRT
jgi:hypothetical protein